MTTVILTENWYGDLKVFNINDSISKAAFECYLNFTELDTLQHDISAETNYFYTDEEWYGGDFSQHTTLQDAIQKGNANDNLSFSIYDRNGTFVMGDNDV